MEIIKSYFFILSIVFILRIIIEIIIKLTQTEPEKISINSIEKILIYFSVSYIITYIIN
jgi:hypothetical protein